MVPACAFKKDRYKIGYISMNTMATEVVICANCSHRYELSGSDECVAIGRPEI